jgi:FkbM family methyltransferase
MWYSQLGQDREVVEFYKEKRNGYFVEIGANDGMKLSNTYALERDYDWKGICVEPIPIRFQECKNSRPQSICFQYAVASQGNTIIQFNVRSNDLFSGIRPKVSFLNKPKLIRVETRTFQQILEEAEAPFHIDYLSIDTEGNEYDILKSVNLNQYTFGVIDVEHNYEDVKRSNIRSLLESNGYTFYKENQWDDRYIKK